MIECLLLIGFISKIIYLINQSLNQNRNYTIINIKALRRNSTNYKGANRSTKIIGSGHEIQNK